MIQPPPSPARPSPQLQIADPVLAKIAAHVAVTTPGVARLHPPLARIVGRAAADAVRNRVLATESGSATAADPAAVSIDHPDQRPLVLVVRIIATGQPPVLTTAVTLQQRIHDALARVAEIDSDVRIHIVALDPPEHPEG